MQKLMLLIDVPPRYSTVLELAAKLHGMETVRVDGDLAVHVEQDSVVLIVLHSGAGKQSTIDRVRTLRKLDCDTGLVVIGEGIDPALAFEAGLLRFDELITLPVAIQELCDRCMAVARSQLDSVSDVGSEKSPVMQELGRAIRAASNSESTVLLTGETGTGKSTLAKEIHGLSARSSAPFIHLNCAVLSPALIESELFGHERGAFTGAVGSRTGRIEAAAGGTLFLDEIGEMEHQLQAKLLRVLEEREYERVGGTRTINMTARIIAATNRDLAEAVGNGEFRSDLFFRLGAFHIAIPALRERCEDLPALIEGQVGSLSERAGVRRPSISSDFVERLMDYSWPGNLRELINVLDTILIRESPRVLVPRHFEQLTLLGNAFKTNARLVSPKTAVIGLTRSDSNFGEVNDADELRDLLLSTGGNVARAARRLNVPRSTLRYRIAQQRLEEFVPRD
jgi:two-component system response regulator AtoC